MKKVIEINDVSPIVLSGANDENIKLEIKSILSQLKNTKSIENLLHK